ncbi:MAG: DUF2153 domain-containing protein [Thermoprotei archaeon]|nr:MAG: DUF2153 domain-containing protein [Thermoprotei archaeon]RLF00937.1 MAG: DUF2153 domain-containing protein [Thermoprotei archaeon]
MSLVDIFTRLDSWIETQKKNLDLLKNMEKELEEADRLSLLLATRVACRYINDIIRDFDTWLENPTVLYLMPEPMLKELRAKLWDVMYELIKFDIKHTSEYRNYLKKLKEEGKLPLMLRLPLRERTSRGAPRYPSPI